MKCQCGLLIVLVFLGLNLPSTRLPHTKAQEERPWEMIFFSSQDNALYIVNEQGLAETIQADIFSAVPDEGLYRFSLSSNRQYLAYGGIRMSRELGILDLHRKTELTVYPPDERPFMDLWMGDFNADSTQFTFGFRLEDPASKYGMVAGVATFDLATKTIDQYLLAPDEAPWLPLSVRWTEDKVLLQLSNNYYEAPGSGFYSVWVPGETAFEETTLYWSDRSATLPLTNELILSTTDFDYPHTGEEGYQQMVANILRYYPNMEELTQQDTPPAQYIYFDETDFLTSVPLWVMDGAGILHHDMETRYHLILRDSTQIPFELNDVQGIWGTTTGWLVHQEAGLIHYRYENGQIVETFIWEYTGKLNTIKSIPLGESSTGTFATIPPYAWGGQSCGGSLPGRLQNGVFAVPVAEEAQTLYSEPEFASSAITQIVSYEMVMALNSPTCVGKQIWWRVGVRGDTIGWLPETDEVGETYFLQPRSLPNYGYEFEEYQNLLMESVQN